MLVNGFNQYNNVSFGMFGFKKRHAESGNKNITNPNKLSYSLEALGNINKSTIFLKNPQLELASKNLEDKMFDQTFTHSKYSINYIASRVLDKTNAQKETIQETMNRLTQFSSYSQLDSLGEEIKNLDIGTPVYASKLDFSLGSVLSYLADKKQQFDYNFDERKETLFVDNLILDSLEKGENSELIEKIKEKNIPVVIFDGWNAKIDNKDVSYTLFGSQIGLENSTIALIKKMQKENLTLDEALNKETIDRIQNLFGEDVEIKIIQNKKALKDSSCENIANNLKPNLPNKDEIEQTINKIIDKNFYGVTDKKETERAKILLADYFNSMICCYSAQTISNNLKQKFDEIEDFALKKGKTIDDVYYIIPNTQKSFDLITYQYLKTNNVGLDKVIHYGKETQKDFSLENYDGKIFVLLDDIVGSATSVLNDNFKYYDFTKECKKNNLDINFVFAPLTALSAGIRNIKEEMQVNRRSNDDIILVNNVIDYSKFEQSLNPQDKALLSKALGGIGFSAGRACTSMPYMIPDNCTQASGFLLTKTLNRNNSKANKASGSAYL